MRLSADAKAYAAAHPADVGALSDNGQAEGQISFFDQNNRLKQLLAEAFQCGFEHAKASQRRVQKFAKGKM